MHKTLLLYKKVDLKGKDIRLKVCPESSPAEFMFYRDKTP